jgi:poly(A) polymerase/tRNA nucleotidyltransferase (CCA-adding enzyme)
MTTMLMVKFAQKGKQIYLVGGGVRNLLKLEPPVNCDFTTDATPEEIQSILADYNPFYDNPYGTVGVAFTNPQGEKEVYEITPFRTESGYSDRRRPDEVKWGTNLEEDLKRRDFTINAIVVGVEKGEFFFIDYFDGLKDLRQKRLRTVGDPSQRFAEDALRMMRAVRFSAQLGLKIEPQTLAGIKANSKLLENISQERIRDELFKILASPVPAKGIQLLVETKLIEHVIPELLESQGIAQTGHHTLTVYEHLLSSLENCPSSDPLVRLAVLLHDIGKPATRRLLCPNCKHRVSQEDITRQGKTAKATRLACPRCHQAFTEHDAATFYGHEVVGARMAKKIAVRLRLSNKQTDKLVTLVRWHMFNYDPKMTDAAIRRFIRRVGKENISEMMLLRIADRKGSQSKTTSWRLQELQKRIGEQLFEPMSISDMAVNGHLLIKELAIQPGPQLGLILKQLFEEVMEDTTRNTKEYLLKRAKELSKEIPVTPIKSQNSRHRRQSSAKKR